MKYGVIVHGGAVPSLSPDYQDDLAFLQNLANEGRALVKDNVPAVEVALSMLKALEDCGRFIAGRGASPNEAGHYALDACIIDGATGKSGSVAALGGYQNPSEVAYCVLKSEREALFVGDGAAKIAQKYGCVPIETEQEWYRPRFSLSDALTGHGYSTAGVVVCDLEGNLSAGTTTGGLMGKPVGRVGDTPIIGAGTYCDEQTAISCTGDGQAFYRAAASSLVAHRQELLDEPLDQSVGAALSRVARFGGTGAIIALSRTKGAFVAHNSAGVKCGLAFDEHPATSAISFG